MMWNRFETPEPKALGPQGCQEQNASAAKKPLKKQKAKPQAQKRESI